MKRSPGHKEISRTGQSLAPNITTLKEAKLTKKEREAINKSLRSSKRKKSTKHPSNLIGERFGDVIVLRKLSSAGLASRYECIDVCGNWLQLTLHQLAEGYHVLSCKERK